MVRFTILAGVALLLAGCGPAVTNVVAATEIPSLMATGKTADDNVSSAVTRQDCSLERALKGGSYCQPRPLPPAPVVTTTRVTYCYSSLASVTCYDHPVIGDAEGFVGVRVDQVPPVSG